jgi:spore photoproduct lyase
MNNMAQETEYLKNIEHIILVGEADRHPRTGEIIARAGVKKVSKMDVEAYNLFLQHLPYSASKKVLALKVFPGSFARACPGTQLPYLCCRYEIISPNVNCPIGCSYCILQCYLNEPVNIVYVNIEQAVDDALKRYAGMSDRLIRVGTGELGDSLAFEPWTRMGEYLVDAFGGKQNIVFELKSKTVCIDHLLKRQPPVNAVLSWSLNPGDISGREEPFAADVSARIAAAGKAAEHGYMVGFHFDPIIYHDRGEELYRQLAEQLLSEIPGERIAWISLGCMRFPAELLPVVREYQPQSRIFSDEMIRGIDGKWRYPKPVRRRMYRWISDVLIPGLPDVFIYLCMEKPEVWTDVLGWSPQHNTEFDRKFADNLKKRFPGLTPNPR